MYGQCCVARCEASVFSTSSLWRQTRVLITEMFSLSEAHHISQFALIPAGLLYLSDSMVCMESDYSVFHSVDYEISCHTRQVLTLSVKCRLSHSDRCRWMTTGSYAFLSCGEGTSGSGSAGTRVDKKLLINAHSDGLSESSN